MHNTIWNRSRILKRAYSSMFEVRQDLLLMFDNCELYNDPKSILCAEARRLRGLLQESSSCGLADDSEANLPSNVSHNISTRLGLRRDKRVREPYSVKTEIISVSTKRKRS